MHTQPLIVKGKVKLKHFDPGYNAGLDKDKTKDALVALHGRIDELQQLLYANSTHSLLLLFQGMDASGKDGAIRSVLHNVNPAGVQAESFKAPSDEERAHDYLWRVHRAVPRYGFIGVFNRSHYEAVLVERVMEIVPRKVWSRRYREIVEWERMLVDNRVVLLKFFLHVSREEQAERLRDRLDNPKKNWKFSADDLATRSRWDEYAKAYEDLLSATSQPHAPWHVIPGDRNWYRDFVIAQTVIKAMEGLRMKWPKPKQDLSKFHVK